MFPRPRFRTSSPRALHAAALLFFSVWGCEAPEPPVPADAQAPTAGRNDERWLDAPYVVLVSLDGFASRYMQQYGPPTLTMLAEQGVWAREGMIPVYPPKTYPNHYSIATGLYPARHGLVANTFYDEERDAVYRLSDREKVEDGTWYDGEPLWVTAETQGMVAACYYWVGSEADVAGVRPSHWKVYEHERPHDDRVQQVLEWLQWPPEFRPHLVTLYLSDTDDAGHGFGPDSPEVAEAVARIDATLGRLIEGLAALPHGDRITVIVVSDHGMDGYTPETTAYIADALGSMEGIRMPESGPTGNLWVEGGPERIRAVRDSIDQALEHVSVWLADETPERLHYRGNPRMGDLVVMPDSGWVVYPENDRPAQGGFTHGWDNTLLSMRSLFVATGPRLRGGQTVTPFANVDVYPLVTELLGLTPPADIDGDARTWGGVLGPGDPR